MSMTTFGSRLSTCIRVLQKESLLTYGVNSPGQSRGISPLQGGGGCQEMKESAWDYSPFLKKAQQMI